MRQVFEAVEDVQIERKNAGMLESDQQGGGGAAANDAEAAAHNRMWILLPLWVRMRNVSNEIHSAGKARVMIWPAMA